MLPYALLQLEQRFGGRDLETRVPGGVGVFEVAVGGVGDVDLLAAGGDVEPGGGGLEGVIECREEGGRKLHIPSESIALKGGYRD